MYFTGAQAISIVYLYINNSKTKIISSNLILTYLSLANLILSNLILSIYASPVCWQN